MATDPQRSESRLFSDNFQEQPLRAADRTIQIFQLKEERTMLVLTRKVGEKIQIGDDIVLTVLEVAGRHIRLGVDAPRQVPILRAELADPNLEQPVAVLPLR